LVVRQEEVLLAVEVLEEVLVAEVLVEVVPLVDGKRDEKNHYFFSVLAFLGCQKQK
jgi:hypothetical protein